VAFLGINDDRAEALFATAYTTAAEHWHMVTPDGDDLIEGRAIVYLLKCLRPTRLVGVVVSWLHLEFGLTGCDRVLSRLRVRLSRLTGDCEGPLRYP